MAGQSPREYKETMKEAMSQWCATNLHSYQDKTIHYINSNKFKGKFYNYLCFYCKQFNNIDTSHKTPRVELSKSMLKPVDDSNEDNISFFASNYGQLHVQPAKKLSKRIDSMNRSKNLSKNLSKNISAKTQALTVIPKNEPAGQNPNESNISISYRHI